MCDMSVQTPVAAEVACIAFASPEMTSFKDKRLSLGARNPVKAMTFATRRL